MVQGAQHRMIRSTASAGREPGRAIWRRARSQAHPSKKGSNEPSAGLVSNDKPHSKPYRDQSRRREGSARRSVDQRSVAARRAESDVSQIHSKGTITALGKTAQSQAAAAPTATLATRLPAWKMGMHAAVEKKTLRNTHAKNEWIVKTPKHLNTSET